MSEWQMDLDEHHVEFSTAVHVRFPCDWLARATPAELETAFELETNGIASDLRFALRPLLKGVVEMVTRRDLDAMMAVVVDDDEDQAAEATGMAMNARLDEDVNLESPRPADPGVAMYEEPPDVRWSVIQQIERMRDVEFNESEAELMHRMVDSQRRF